MHINLVLVHILNLWIHHSSLTLSVRSVNPEVEESVPVVTRNYVHAVSGDVDFRLFGEHAVCLLMRVLLFLQIIEHLQRLWKKTKKKRIYPWTRLMTRVPDTKCSSHNLVHINLFFAFFLNACATHNHWVEIEKRYESVNISPGIVFSMKKQAWHAIPRLIFALIYLFLSLHPWNISERPL